MVTEVSGASVDPSTGGNALALPSLENGWPLRPSRIVSLYDIVKPFFAGRYLRATNIIANLRSVIARLGSDVLSATAKTELLSAFEKVMADCADMELTASFSTAEKIMDLARTETDCRMEDLDELLDEFRGRMADEIHARECFLLTLSEARHYKEPRKGWESIIERFPDTAIDIEEASKCLAVSRYTAAVFHSLLVVEVGLIELGIFIGVNDPMSGWTAVAGRLKKIIDTKYQDLSEFEKANRPFLEQMQGTVEALKNAWRNKVSHVHGKLTLMGGEEFHPDVAEEILFATRSFMRRLAEGLPPSAA